MDILILLPPGKLASGNRATADRYARLLKALGHTVRVHDQLGDETPDLLIAIHARKTREALTSFHTHHPATPTILILAGTDIYPDPSEPALDSMRIADRLVTLQDRAQLRIPEDLRSKARTIIQSATPVETRPPGVASDDFQICVIGHLRAVKDPMRAAAASRLLPAESRIRILHVGRIVDDEFAALVEKEQSENPRYRWMGELAGPDAVSVIAASRLQVLSSIEEGGAQVLGESIVSGTPLLASRHDAALSLLGDDYPGLFEIGDTAQLATLMTRAETDPGFLADLHDWTTSLADQFDPQRESDAWRALLAHIHEGLDKDAGSVTLPGDPSAH